MTSKIDMRKERFTAVHTLVEDALVEDVPAEDALVGGAPVLRVIKKDKLHLYDENTYAKVDGLQFHNCIIEVKLLSRLLPDAPDFARGFIGIVYRIDARDSEFEGFYVRPTNGRTCLDPARRAHGCQYFSYPGYTFSYFREYGIDGYEAEADIDLDEWITLKAVIQDERAAFYIGQGTEPVLVVEDMKHGSGQKGAVGIFVDTGTEAFVAEMKVTCTD